MFNIIVILISAFIAVVAPFDTLIISYAVLGTLHYFTEISWLHNRSYYTSSRNLTLALLGGLSIVNLYHRQTTGLSYTTASLVGFMIAVFLIIENKIVKWGALAFCSLCLIGINYYNVQYFLDMAIMLPTIIHVCLFTFLFMLLGSLKEKSRSGYFSLLIYLGCIFLCLYGPFDGLSYEHWIIEPQLINKFTFIMHPIQNRFSLHHVEIHRLFRLVSFVYLYHYLNWFTKTKVIGWAEISLVRAVLIVVSWLLVLGLYHYDFILGLTVTFVFSFGHVVLEFPLNLRTIKGIYKEVIKGV
jgi:hypothetical protein